MPDLVIHGHFYQPPRENPWTGEIEYEAGAAPFHDWNERIYAECYGPNAFATLGGGPDESGSAINNYAHLSFNFGPTLLTWLAPRHPDTYARILTADRESAAALGGHGNAIAQGYNHAILPLCNERDMRTQIRWGMADFQHRFDRTPESLWLPETACNAAVLAALIDEGLSYAILEPHQAGQIRRLGEEEWRSITDGNIDTGISYKYLHPDGSGRSIALFFYHGGVSRALAFEGLLRSSREFVDRLQSALGNGDLVNIATDGETYGHHFKFGDVCLAHTLTVEAPGRDFTITNYGDHLERYPPLWEVSLNNGPDGEGTSWSCIHGVGRWTRDCGCHTGGEPNWNQRWREPLRRALDFLRDENIVTFEATRGSLFTDPWLARDDSIVLVLDPLSSREVFLHQLIGRRLTPVEQERALTYLEIQRMTQLMYTSCGWFFNDLGGLETLQVLKYACRAIDLMGQLGLPSIRQGFLELLSEARSNRPELGNGADIYQRFIEPLQFGRNP